MEFWSGLKNPFSGDNENKDKKEKKEEKSKEAFERTREIKRIENEKRASEQLKYEKLKQEAISNEFDTYKPQNLKELKKKEVLYANSYLAGETTFPQNGSYIDPEAININNPSRTIS